MRTWLLFAGLLLSTSTFAQGIDFPVRCNERLLTPTVEALCRTHRSATREAEEKYLSALSRVDSIASLKALRITQGTFMISYHICAIKGEAVAVAACLAPAFEVLLNRLPALPTNPSFDLKAEARTANALVLSQAYDAFNVCTFARIKALDDGISSARDIALSISAACKPQAMDIASISLGAHNASFIADTPTMRDQLDLAEHLVHPDQLVTNVLEYRAKKRSTPQQQQKGPSSRKVQS